MRPNVFLTLLLTTLTGPGLAQTTAPPAAPLTPLTVPAQIVPQAPSELYRMPAPGPVVQAQITQGLLGGRQEQGVNRFLGVPYAAPPLGELRWRPPQAPPAWPGRRDASRFGDICPQRPNPITGNLDRTISGNEDCLYLNVYAPAQVQNAPVMVWVHGGSFDTGTGNIYDGLALARDYGVVVVTLNYRLGRLGFLAAPALGEQGTGNYGLMDVQAALQWVKTNSSAFGGDSGNVTAFGESAGGMILCDLLTSPRSAGLFQKAIFQSGPCATSLNTPPLNQALDTGAAYTRDLECSTAPDAAACLRGKTVTELLDLPVPGSRAPNSVALPPVYGDAVVPLEPLAAYRSGQFMQIPLLLGGNRDEGSIFTAYLAPPDKAMSVPLYWGLITVLNPSKTLSLLREYPAGALATTGLSAAALVTDGLFACPVNSVAKQAAASCPPTSTNSATPWPSANCTPPSVCRSWRLPRLGTGVRLRHAA